MNSRNFSVIAFAISVFAISATAQRVNKEHILDSSGKEQNCSHLVAGRASHSALPVYPQEARLAGISGIVKVRLAINSEGKLDKVLSVDGPEQLKDAARNAAATIKFSPTKCDGVDIGIISVITYNFSPEPTATTYFTPKSIDDFHDISRESPYYESLIDLTENYQIAFGLTEKHFYPDQPLSKGEFAQFLFSTLKTLEKQSEISGKNFRKLNIYRPISEGSFSSLAEITDIDLKDPYASAVEGLGKDYGIILLDGKTEFRGKRSLTIDDVISYWTKLFGAAAIPVNFNSITFGDRVITRGEFAVFLRESLYVLSYQTLP